MQLQWKEEFRDEQREHGARCPRCPRRLRHGGKKRQRTVTAPLPVVCSWLLAGGSLGPSRVHLASVMEDFWQRPILPFSLFTTTTCEAILGQVAMDVRGTRCLLHDVLRALSFFGTSPSMSLFVGRRGLMGHLETQRCCFLCRDCPLRSPIRTCHRSCFWSLTSVECLSGVCLRTRLRSVCVPS